MVKSQNRKLELARRAKFIEDINTKKYAIEILKRKLHSYSLKIQASTATLVPLWKITITLFVYMKKEKKNAVRNILCSINYYLKLLLKKSIISTPIYCQETWKELNEFWNVLKTNVKYTNIVKRNSMAIEQILAALIDLNILTIETSPESTCFDIYDRLSFLNEHSKDMDLDVLLHCKTLVVPQYRKINHYITVLKKTLDNRSNGLLEISTFLKLSLLARIVLVMVKEDEQCRFLLLTFYEKLLIPNNFKKYAEQNKLDVPEGSLTLKTFIKNIDVVYIFKFLYSPKRVNLIDETFEITERQESLQVHTTKKQLGKENKKSNNAELVEPRDLFTVHENINGPSSTLLCKKDTNMSGSDCFDDKITKSDKKSKKSLVDVKLLKSSKSKSSKSVSDKSSKEILSNSKDIKSLFTVNEPRDLFHVPMSTSGSEDVHCFKETVPNLSIEPKKRKLNIPLIKANQVEITECSSTANDPRDLFVIQKSKSSIKSKKIKNSETLSAKNKNVEIGDSDKNAKKRKLNQCNEVGKNMIASSESPPLRKIGKNIKSKVKSKFSDHKIKDSNTIINCDNHDLEGNIVSKNSAKVKSSIRKRKRKFGENGNKTISATYFTSTEPLTKKKKIDAEKPATEVRNELGTAVKEVNSETIKFQKGNRGEKRVDAIKPRLKIRKDKKGKKSVEKQESGSADDKNMEVAETPMTTGKDLWNDLTQTGIPVKSVARRRRRKKLISEAQLTPLTHVEENSTGSCDDDSDLEIIEETNSMPATMGECATYSESEESEIDEASSSDEDIAPLSETKLMYTKKSTNYNKELEEELQIENKIIEVLEKRMHKDLKNQEKFAMKVQANADSALAIKENCKQLEKLKSKDENSSGSLVLSKLDHCKNVEISDSEDDLEIIDTKSGSPIIKNEVQMNKLVPAYVFAKPKRTGDGASNIMNKLYKKPLDHSNDKKDDLEIVYECDKRSFIPTTTKINGARNLKLTGSSQTENKLLVDHISVAKTNGCSIEFVTVNVNLQTKNSTVATAKSIAEDDDIQTVKVSPNIKSSNSKSSLSRFDTALDDSIHCDINGDLQTETKLKVRPYALSDVNTEDSVSSTSDIGDEAYEAGCSDTSEDYKRKKQLKSKQKRLFTEEASSSLQRRRRSSSLKSFSPYVNINSEPLATSNSGSVANGQFSVISKKVTSPIAESMSLRLEVDNSPSHTKKEGTIKSTTTNDRSQHHLSVEALTSLNNGTIIQNCNISNDDVESSITSSKDLNLCSISDDNVISNINLQVASFETAEDSCFNGSIDSSLNSTASNEIVKRISESKECYEQIKRSDNKIKQKIDLDTKSCQGNLSYKKKGSSSVKSIELEDSCSFNIRKSSVSSVDLGSTIENIMAETTYENLDSTDNSDSLLSKVSDNKGNIENNEQEGEEVEVLSTSSIEAATGVLVDNAVTSVSKEKTLPAVSTSPDKLDISTSTNEDEFISLKNRRILVQEMKSPNKRNSLNISNPKFPTPLKVPTAVLIDSELIISPGVSDEENEIGKEINSHVKLIESLPSLDQPDPWIRSKSPQKITQEEQTDIIEKNSNNDIRSPLLINTVTVKSPTKTSSKSSVKPIAHSSIQHLPKSPSMTCKSVSVTASPLSSSKRRSSGLHDILNSSSQRISKSPVKSVLSFNEEVKPVTPNCSDKAGRLSLSRTRKSPRISDLSNMDSDSPSISSSVESKYKNSKISVNTITKSNLHLKNESKSEGNMELSCHSNDLETESHGVSVNSNAEFDSSLKTKLESEGNVESLSLSTDSKRKSQRITVKSTIASESPKSQNLSKLEVYVELKRTPLIKNLGCQNKDVISSEDTDQENEHFSNLPLEKSPLTLSNRKILPVNNDSDSSVGSKGESKYITPPRPSTSSKVSQKSVNENSEEKDASDSEDRDKVFSPIKRTTRSSMITRRLTSGLTSMNELDLNSPRRSRRSSISSLTTQEDSSSVKDLLDSPARTTRARRNSTSNTLTPVRRSRRISGIMNELSELK